MEVVFVWVTGSVLPPRPCEEPRIGSLMREARIVAWYLSEAKSICTPLKSGLENVIGVRVVRIRSPTVIA